MGSTQAVRGWGRSAWRGNVLVRHVPKEIRMETIVVAEDDAVLCHMIQEALTEFRAWLVCTVGDGGALLETLTCLVPTLVVLDVPMPHCDGISAYRRLRERRETHAVPVLFLTAEPDLVWEAELDGQYEVLEKPFDLEVLEQRVSHLIVSAA